MYVSTHRREQYQFRGIFPVLFRNLSLALEARENVRRRFEIE